MTSTGVCLEHPSGSTSVPFRTALPLVNVTSSCAYGKGPTGVCGRLSFEAPGTSVSGKDCPDWEKVPATMLPR